MTLYKWSQTASADATADSTINWAEGQSPASVNDSARAMMAAMAKYRDDNSGALITGGTSTAYTLTSNQVFSSKAVMNGAEISFTINATNGPSPTLNVDGLGADPITLDGINAVPTGTLIAGSVYTAVYYFSGTAWRLKDFYQLPFTVPIGGTIDYFGTTPPNSNFVFPYGQAISRTTYSALFVLLGTTFGTGDGSTTFNVPDLRGRVVAGKDDMGGSAASRLTSTYFGTSAAALGAVGGVESHTLMTAEIPTGITSSNSGSISLTGTTNSYTAWTTSNIAGSASPGGSQLSVPGSPGGQFGQMSISGTITAGNAAVTSTNTGGGAHRNIQPTIIANKLLRII
ncbi:phage tail protein [Bradyrhizobium lupini]|uniref:phage tail protein n=1 Tax=Rhizobium lupini TaxID=136996 RepID=UPI00366F99B3